MVGRMFDSITDEDIELLTEYANDAGAAPDRHDAWVPGGLDAMEPGAALAAYVSAIDPTRLCGHAQIVALRAQQRLVSHFAAQLYRTMTAVVDTISEVNDSPHASSEEAAAAEIGCALHLTRRAADTELMYAIGLRRRLPRVWEALAAGRIDPRRAKTMLTGTDHLSMAHARDVVTHVLAVAPT